jgi:FkbM family methyltransferase
VSYRKCLSFKEKLFVFISYLPWKFNKFCPSYLKEFESTCQRIIEFGGSINPVGRKVIVLFEGAKYSLRIGSTDFLVFNQVILGKEYEPIIELIGRNISSFTDFKIIDAGANVGLASIYFKKIFANSKIIAIEPDLMNFEALNKHIELNNYLGEIISLRGGIWGANMKLNLSNSFRDGREWSLNLEETGLNETGSIDAYTLEELMRMHSFETVDFLKIDIEGGEKNLFETWNLNSDVLQRVKYLALEIHDEIVDRKFIQGILIRSGFNLQEINETTFGVNMNFK